MAARSRKRKHWLITFDLTPLDGKSVRYGLIATDRRVYRIKQELSSTLCLLPLAHF